VTAHSLRAALRESFDFDEWGLVFGVFADKDAAGIVDELSTVVSRVFATSPESERALDADAVADLVEGAGLPVTVHPDLSDAVDAAREWAAASDRRAVVIAGSIVLAGQAVVLSAAEDWKAGWHG